MEITEETKCVFYVAKLLGLAPYTVNKKPNSQLNIKRSLTFCFYSISMVLLFTFLTYFGTFYDEGNSTKNTIRTSLKSKSATSKIVKTLDVSVVVPATIAGVICGICGFHATQNLNCRLQQMELELRISLHSKTERRRAILIVVVPFAILTILLGFGFVQDVWTLIDNNSGNQQHQPNLKALWNLPFYGLYYILIGLHVNIANTMLGLAQRYKRLNIILKEKFLKDNNSCALTSSAPHQTVIDIKPLMQPILMFSSWTAGGNTSKNVFAKAPDFYEEIMFLRRFAETHKSLCNCMTAVSSSFGFAILFILVSCLLHLVATGYFLIVDLLTRKEHNFYWFQITWIFFHSLRLFLIVEPCHLATIESRKTIQVICEIERQVHDSILAEEFKKFWQQLLVIRADITACGLCKVNRHILTSIGSATATYLIILIQFHKSDG